ncbi:MAG: hypothetical protein A4E54_01444 [Pelotomaculum sp. PtaB.Bin117]|nr:MAG: hypothetical protein A4E54_01444 [Pelotomaculum sp. PtaB.Bin117]
MALVILSVSLAAMMDGFVTACRGNADIYRYNTALSLAQSKMEEIKNSPFILVKDIALVDFAGESDYAGFAGFRYSVAVADNDLISKTVIVTVSYNDAGISEEVALTGEIARR